MTIQSIVSKVKLCKKNNLAGGYQTMQIFYKFLRRIGLKPGGKTATIKY